MLGEYSLGGLGFGLRVCDVGFVVVLIISVDAQGLFGSRTDSVLSG